MPGKVWGEITYPFLNFNGAALPACKVTLKDDG